MGSVGLYQLGHPHLSACLLSPSEVPGEAGTLALPSGSQPSKEENLAIYRHGCSTGFTQAETNPTGTFTWVKD